jgi:6-phosphogluconolactonase (cycloisomerase 2 family)
MGNDWISQALKRMLSVAVAGLLLIPAAASAAPPPVGGLTPLPGASGCFAGTATPGSCQAANGIFSPESATVSPDGKFVYVGSYPATVQGSNQGTAGLAVLARNPQTGALTPISGPSGCYTSDGSSLAGPGTCTRVEGLGNGDGRDLAITSDGKWAYMVNQGQQSSVEPPGSVVIFRRDPATGALTQLASPNGCISKDGSSQDGAGMCQTLATISQPDGITLSSDDRFVYVTDYGFPGSIHVLSRDATTGALSEVQCLSDTTPTPAGCTAGRQLGVVQALVISPDGLHAYAANFNEGISIFDRDPQTGLLTQKPDAAGCINKAGTNGCDSGRLLNGAYAIRIAPDGHTLYVTAQNDSGVAVFHVGADGALTQLAGSEGCVSLTGADGAGGSTCAVGRALEGAYGDAISPDGRTLYVSELANHTSDGGVAVFSVDPSTGAITQLPGAAGCITADGKSNGVAGACAIGGPAITNAYSLNLSPDGTSLYVAAYVAKSLTTFAVEHGPTCQSSTASTAYQTPVTVSLSCADGDGDPLSAAVASGPAHGTLGQLTDGTVTYTPASGYTGTDSFSFDTSDGTNASSPATVTIAVGAPPAPPAQPAPPRPARVTRATESHRRWREVKHGGTTFSFTLNEAARVSFTFTQRGHKRSAGSLTVAGHAGTNKLAFNGRLNRHVTLKPGVYTVTIRTGTSTPRRLTFTIAK